MKRGRSEKKMHDLEDEKKARRRLDVENHRCGGFGDVGSGSSSGRR